MALWHWLWSQSFICKDPSMCLTGQGLLLLSHHPPLLHILLDSTFSPRFPACNGKIGNGWSSSPKALSVLLYLVFARHPSWSVFSLESCRPTLSIKLSKLPCYPQKKTPGISTWQATFKPNFMSRCFNSPGPFTVPEWSRHILASKFCVRFFLSLESPLLPTFHKNP